MAKQTVKAEKPAKVEVPKHETDTEQLLKDVDYLSKKVKSQSELIHLIKSQSDSCEGQISELYKIVKKLALTAGVLI